MTRGTLYVRGILMCGLFAFLCGAARAQQPGETKQPDDMNSAQQPVSAPQPTTTTSAPTNAVSTAHRNWVVKLVKDFGEDQKDLWTSPRNLGVSDTAWIIPAAGIGAGFFVTDADVSAHLSQNPSTLSHYKTISDAGLGALVGGAGALWVFGHFNHNAHWRETGFLAGEAAINDIVVTEALKYSLGRERPFQGDGSGAFFQGGTSFPSEHASVAWAVAGVIAHEYPGTISKLLAYGAAGLISYSRIRARQHFPADVFVGSMLGEMVGQNIYSRRYDPEFGGSPWESWSSKALRSFKESSPGYMGSPYVPLDSWVYPAMERLIAMGYIRSAMLDMRPWTRLECARLLTEAGEILEGVTESSQAAKTYAKLYEEFHPDMELLAGGDNGRASLERVYTRATQVTGRPLSQGYQYNFGQTDINDFGRPEEQGFNNVTGGSAWLTEGYFTAYFSGEFRRAPSAPPITPTAGAVFPPFQSVPAPPNTAIPQIDRFQLLDTYFGITLANWQITYGKQSLWWGPGEGGAMMFSDNAVPLNMLRINRVSPFVLPSVLKYFGPIRVEIFLGQLSGQPFIFGEETGYLGSWTNPFSPQPMIAGQRFSFKPTKNLDFGFSSTNLFAGEGRPFTLHTYLKGIFRFGSNALPGTPGDPGDSRSGFDLSYRLPFVRDWVTFYADGFTDDQFSPIAYWDRSAWSAGLYFSHIPKLPKLDFRVEGVYTDVPAGGGIGRGFYYWNSRYVSGYTNAGYLMGSWIGRDGQGAQAWTNYWFTPKNKLQFNFRHEKVSQQFIPQGGSVTDVGALSNFEIREGWNVNLSVQYERWLFPVIRPGEQTNFSTSIGFEFQPRKIYSPLMHLAGPYNSAAGDKN